MKKALAVTVLLILVLPSIALATGFGEALGSFVEETVFPILGAAVMALLAIGLRKLAQKWNSDLLRNNEQALMAAAFKGVAFAEEWGAKRVKAKLAEKTTGNEKMDEAIKVVLESVPGVTPAQAKKAIESIIGSTVGVGATGNDTV